MNPASTTPSSPINAMSPSAPPPPEAPPPHTLTAATSNSTLNPPTPLPTTTTTITTVDNNNNNNSLLCVNPSFNSSTTPQETTRGRSLTYHDLSRCFHLPINSAARELGVCVTALKKQCRKHGVQRWPHRKLKSLDKLKEKLEKEEATAADKEYYKHEIHSIVQKKDHIFRANSSSFTQQQQQQQHQQQQQQQQQQTQSAQHQQHPQQQHIYHHNVTSLPQHPHPHSLPLHSVHGSGSAPVLVDPASAASAMDVKQSIASPSFVETRVQPSHATPPLPQSLQQQQRQQQPYSIPPHQDCISSVHSQQAFMMGAHQVPGLSAPPSAPHSTSRPGASPFVNPLPLSASHLTLCGMLGCDCFFNGGISSQNFHLPIPIPSGPPGPVQIPNQSIFTSQGPMSGPSTIPNPPSAHPHPSQFYGLPPHGYAYAPPMPYAPQPPSFPNMVQVNVMDQHSYNQAAAAVAATQVNGPASQQTAHVSQPIMTRSHFGPASGPVGNSPQVSHVHGPSSSPNLAHDLYKSPQLNDPATSSHSVIFASNTPVSNVADTNSFLQQQHQQQHQQQQQQKIQEQQQQQQEQEKEQRQPQQPQQVSHTVPTHYWTSDVGRSRPGNNTFTLFNQSTHVHHHHNSGQNPVTSPVPNVRKDVVDVSASSNSETSARRHARTISLNKNRATSVAADNSTNGTTLRETATTDTDKRSGMLGQADTGDEEIEDEEIEDEKIEDEDSGDEEIEDEDSGDVVADSGSNRNRLVDKRQSSAIECNGQGKDKWHAKQMNEKRTQHSLDQKDNFAHPNSLIELESKRNTSDRNGLMKNGLSRIRKRGRYDNDNVKSTLLMDIARSDDVDDDAVNCDESRFGDNENEYDQNLHKDTSSLKIESVSARKRNKRPRNGLAIGGVEGERGRWHNMFSRRKDYNTLISSAAKRELSKDDDISYRTSGKQAGNEGLSLNRSMSQSTRNMAKEKEGDDSPGDPKGDSTEREEMNELARDDTGLQVNGNSDPPSPRMTTTHEDKPESRFRRKRMRRDGKINNVAGTERERDEEIVKESENESGMLSLGVGTESGATGGAATNDGMLMDGVCSPMLAGYKSRARRYELVVHGCVSLGCAQWCTDRGLKVTMAIGSKALLAEMNVGSIGRNALYDGSDDRLGEGRQDELLKIHGDGGPAGVGLVEGIQKESERKGAMKKEGGGDQEMRKRYHMALMGQRVEWMMRSTHGTCLAYLVVLAPFRKRSGADICGVSGLILESSQR